MCKIYTFIVTFILLVSFATFAQTYKITGNVADGINGEALIGANIFLTGTSFGAASDANGNYSITVQPGSYTITCSYIGYEKVEQDIEVNGDMTLNFNLKDYQFTLSVNVFSDRVKERETPVAFTKIDKEQMKFSLGSRDIPLIMNTTPSVFATDQGGGAGDARINVRGFNQRNIGIMINGIPINDMENGWVYWSNWDGLGDATSSIEMQRGLSAINLATPSIGGTMNIITDPSEHKAGAFFQSEFGTGNFRKQTVFGHTGVVNGFAMSFGGVRKVGDGHADKVWTDAWAYYLGMAYEINPQNRLELYAMGAPQQHGQRRWKLNAATFSHQLARELDFPNEALNDPKLTEQGLLYNSNWNGINSSYNDPQWQRSYWNNDYNQRHDPGYMNESVNYFHKPLVNLNWFSQFSNVFSLYTTIYYSGGQGGGTGTFGSLVWDYSLLQRVADWDATITRNINNIDTTDGTSSSRGILRNSVNSQWTVGGISKAYWKASKNLNTSFGIDVRRAVIDHYREVRDLLGGDYFVFSGNEFDDPSQYRKMLGDHIDYDNTNTVSWVGGYAQAEWTKDIFTVFGTAGYTTIKYDYVDHFRMDDSGGELTLEPGWMSGYQFKGGASIRTSQNVQLFVNAGYVSKVPVFDGVISDWNSTLIENPKNEIFISFEVGANTNFLQKKVTLNGNFYFTDWSNRIDNTNPSGTDDLVRLFDVASRHMGFELEGAWQPKRFIRFDAAFSYGIWEYTDDVQGVYIYNEFPDSSSEQDAYIKDLKVGDAPQTQFALGLTIFPVPGMAAQLLWRSYSNYYSQYDPVSRDDEDDREQVWQIPAYNLFEFHFSYLVPAQVLGMDVTLFAHVFNLTNLLYVQDAVDNSSFNAWSVDGKNHKADDAEIYPGMPTSFNFGFSAAL
jgi:iron complex outermembrane receptor protein